MLVRIAVIFLFFLGHFTLVEAQNIILKGKPNINAPSEIGNYPKTPFLYRIPVSGDFPISLEVSGLPDGLSMDQNGILSGNISAVGTYPVFIVATNDVGIDTATLYIQIGGKLCLTPPMGWNSWNVFAQDISEEVVLKIADEMEKNGMLSLGYQYINLDDYWHADEREADGRPKADSLKFPRGIKWLADHLHSRGFKLGIYSCAGKMTCGKRFGSYGFEELDAKTYAEWGIDLLKYDYCFVPRGREEAIARYKKMGEALRNSGRSIVYSVCEWGVNEPWEWAESVNAHYYRTTHDIFDRWKKLLFFIQGVKSITEINSKLAKYAGPSHWNDPDMLLIGNNGKGKATGRFFSHGLNDVQYASHFALWCFMNAPLLSSSDPRMLNSLGLNTLMNQQLIAINQDALAQQAEFVSYVNGVMILKKALYGNKIAWLVFNTSKKSKKITVEDIPHGLPFDQGIKFKIQKSKNNEVLMLPAYDYEIYLD